MNFETRDKVSEEFFSRRGVEVARDLIGMFLVNSETGCGGIIVETEAYMGEEDPSCHYARNQNGKRAEVFEQGAGTVYVYSIHAHECMNFISEVDGYPEGILIRALKPVKGLDGMRDRRGWGDEQKLCSGPGKLVEAIGVSKKSHNGEKLSEGSLEIYWTDLDPGVKFSGRIGISEAEDWPVRFLVSEGDFVSRPVRQCDRSFDIDGFYRGV
jgi:DNA-3-methyladenine glycosylase